MCSQHSPHPNLSCLTHVIDLGNVVFMNEITKISAVATATAIWDMIQDRWTITLLTVPLMWLPLYIHLVSRYVLNTLSPKTSDALNRNKNEKRKVNIDSGEYLKEYNWGVTTNYSSIYTIVHEVTTRLSM